MSGDLQGPPTPEQVAEAIKADPRVALAAHQAIKNRDREYKARKRKANPRGKQESPVDQFVKAVIKLRYMKRAANDALGLVLDMRGVTDTDDARAAVSEYVKNIRGVLDLIDGAARGESLDDELAGLIDDEEE